RGGVPVGAVRAPRRERASDRGGCLLHVAEEERVVERLLAVEKRARVRGGAVPAPDEDARRELADSDRTGQLDRLPGRARTDRPGARPLLHRRVTVRPASDGADPNAGSAKGTEPSTKRRSVGPGRAQTRASPEAAEPAPPIGVG